MKTKDCTYFDKDTSVRGELSTSDVILEGTFKGKITADGTVLLTQHVTIDAEISTHKLMVEDGATYEGRIFLTNGDE